MVINKPIHFNKESSIEEISLDLNKWLEKKPDDVVFRRMPGIFRKEWIPHAKAYFTAEKLDILNKIHSSLFTAIHKKKKPIYDDRSIKKFFLEHGVDKQEFKKIFESKPFVPPKLPLELSVVNVKS